MRDSLCDRAVAGLLVAITFAVVALTADYLIWSAQERAIARERYQTIDRADVAADECRA